MEFRLCRLQLADALDEQAGEIGKIVAALRQDLRGDDISLGCGLGDERRKGGEVGPRVGVGELDQLVDGGQIPVLERQVSRRVRRRGSS